MPYYAKQDLIQSFTESFISYDISSADKEYTLPSPIGLQGYRIRISWTGGTGTYSLSIVGTINGYSSWEGLGNGSLTIVSDGSTWKYEGEGVFDKGSWPIPVYYPNANVPPNQVSDWTVSCTFLKYTNGIIKRYIKGTQTLTFSYLSDGGGAGASFDFWTDGETPISGTAGGDVSAPSVESFNLYIPVAVGPKYRIEIAKAGSTGNFGTTFNAILIGSWR